MAAAEKEADVILLENLPKPGGNTQFAFGMFACESPLQKRMNINAPRDEFFRIAMDYAQWTINPKIMRAYIDKSGDTIRWLEEKGVVFELPKNQNIFLVYSPPLLALSEGAGRWDYPAISQEIRRIRWTIALQN